MKTIHLTPNEQLLLLDVLRCCLSDLRVEIVGTEHWDYKRRLRERKSTLMQIIEKLEAEQLETEPI